MKTKLTKNQKDFLKAIREDGPVMVGSHTVGIIATLDALVRKGLLSVTLVDDGWRRYEAVNG